MSMGHWSSAIACVPLMSRSQYGARPCHFAPEWPHKRSHAEYLDRQRKTPDPHSQSHEHYQTENAEYPDQTESESEHKNDERSLQPRTSRPANRSKCTDWPHPRISESSDVPSSGPTVLDPTHHYEHDTMGSTNET